MDSSLLKAVGDFGFGAVAFAAVIGFSWYVLRNMGELMHRQGEMLVRVVAQMDSISQHLVGVQTVQSQILSALERLNGQAEKARMEHAQILGIIGDKRSSVP